MSMYEDGMDEYYDHLAREADQNAFLKARKENCQNSCKDCKQEKSEEK